MSMDGLHSKMDQCLISLARLEERMESNRIKLDQTESELEQVDADVKRLDKKIHRFWYILVGMAITMGGPELFKIIKVFI